MRRRKMWKSILLFLYLCGYCYAGPVGTKRNMPIMRQDQPLISEPDASSEQDNEKTKHEIPVPSTLTLPSNATSIRADIMDGFKCDDRPYGYYADVENDCQIFHVCLPVTYADGKENTFRWSFICPEETIFSQDSFTCMRPEDMNIDCSESQNYYDLNRNFGMTEGDTNKEDIHSNLEPVPNKVHEEAYSVFSDKKAQNDVVIVSSSNPEPSVVKPDKPKRVYKPMNSKPLHAVKSKPSNTAPLRKIPQTLEVSEPLITVSTQNNLDTFNQKRRRPVNKVTVENHNKEITPVPVVVPNSEKVSLKSDNRKGVQANTVYNLGKLELPNSSVETAETIKVESAPQFVPTSVEDVLPTDDKETDTKKKLAEEALTVNTVNHVTESDNKESLSNEVVNVEKVNEANQNTEVIANSPTIFEENSEEISSPSVTETKDMALKESNVATTSEGEKVNLFEIIDSATLEEEEKEKPLKKINSLTVEEDKIKEPIKEITFAHAEEEEKDKPSNIVLNQNEKLETGENIPLSISDFIPDSPKVENDVEEEASHVDAVADQSTIQEKLELSTIQDKETVVENVDSENAPAITPTTQLDDSSLKQTMGGFKPVDAEKAAEAEAIITDFLNTLRSTETTHTKLGTEKIAENEDKEDLTEKHETLLTTDESKDTETEVEQSKNESVDENNDIKNLKPESEDKNQSIVQPIVEETKEEELATAQSHDEAPNSLLQELKNIVGGVKPNINSVSIKSGPIATYPIMNSFPSDMYQIPVKVIEAPAGAFEQNEPLVQHENEEFAKEPTIEVVPDAALYTPLSIEDIVDLVKERLDQTPMEEKNKPMHLTVESLQTANSETPVAVQQIKNEEATISNSDSSNAETAATQESEEIVLPIYHRLTENDEVSDLHQAENELSVASSPTQSELTVAETGATTAVKSPINMETENTESLNTNGDNVDENLAKTKTSRLYRSRSIKNAIKMDPRKRRFLFRSDAN